MKRKNKPVFTVRYGDSEYTFNEGAKAFIFHAGIRNDTVKDRDLPEFTEKVYECYITDCNNADLGALADYMRSAGRRSGKQTDMRSSKNTTRRQTYETHKRSTVNPYGDICHKPHKRS